MRRLDQWLVDLGLAPTRAKAQQMIAAGEVYLRGEVVRRPSQGTDRLTREDVGIAHDADTLRYVSRGGLKLAAALDRLALNVTGWRCLDVGVSTGGFTDCLLQRGAKRVAAFDVGHGQLHARLRGHPRLSAWEGVNVRDLPAHAGLTAWIAESGGVDLCVADLSFISLEHALPPIARALPGSSDARLLALVKPQFEVGLGVALDPRAIEGARVRVLHWLSKCGFSLVDDFPSAVKGQDGTQEYFVLARLDPVVPDGLPDPAEGSPRDD